MSQSWCCTGCGTWNWWSRPTCHYCGQTPSPSNGSSWVQVVKKGKTSGKGKGVHIKQQAKQQSNGVQAGSSPDTHINGENLVNVKQLHAQIAAVSKALAELELSGDKELMQPLESRLAELKARLHGARPIGQQVDGLHGVISRCQKRLAEAEIAKVEAEATIIEETEDIASYQAQLTELEPLLASSAGFRKADGPDSGMPEWLANTLSSISKHVQESSNIDRDAVCTIRSRSAGPSTSVYPTRCAAEWNTGQYYRHVRRVESREQARGQCILATEHEQSAAHNEYDDGRDAAARGHQGSQAGNVVRLMIATIKVTSATSRGGANKAHIPNLRS